MSALNSQYITSLIRPDQLKAFSIIGLHVTPDGRILDLVSLSKASDSSRDEIPFTDLELKILIVSCSSWCDLKGTQKQYEDVEEVLTEMVFKKLEILVSANRKSVYVWELLTISVVSEPVGRNVEGKVGGDDEEDAAAA